MGFVKRRPGRWVVGLLALGSLPAWAAPAEVRVSSFGYDAEDSTRFLQQALDSGARRVIVDRQAGPWVTLPIAARSNTEIVFEPGVELLAKRGAFRGLRDYLFRIVSVSNVTLRGGEGATFRMWREDYQKPPYAKGEWRYTLAIRDAKNVLVEGLRFVDSGGDGICIAANSVDVTVRRCVCDRNHRQALTIGSGENILIEDCVLSNTRGNAPQAGVDIEPDTPAHRLVNIVLRNCLSIDNAGSGYEIAPNFNTTKSPPISIRFENCRSVRNLHGTTIYGGWTKTNDFVKGTLTFENCSFEEARVHGICVQTKPADTFDVAFRDCVISRTSPGTTLADVQIGSRELMQQMPDNIDFGNLKIVQATPRDWFSYSPAAIGSLPKSLRGTVELSEPGQAAKRIVLDEAWAAANIPLVNGGRSLPARAGLVPVAPPAGPLASVTFVNGLKCVFFVDKPGVVKFAGEQVITVAGRQPCMKPVKIVSLADSKRTWELPAVGVTRTEFSFEAPERGFYSLEMQPGGTRYALLEASVPVAVDVRRGSVIVAPHRARTFSLWFASPEFGDGLFMAGGSDYCKFAYRLFDPSGREVSSCAELKTSRFVQLGSKAKGLWRAEFTVPPCPYSADWVTVDLFGAPGCFWLSEEGCVK